MASESLYDSVNSDFGLDEMECEKNGGRWGDDWSVEIRYEKDGVSGEYMMGVPDDFWEGERNYRPIWYWEGNYMDYWREQLVGVLGDGVYIERVRYLDGEKELRVENNVSC